MTEAKKPTPVLRADATDDLDPDGLELGDTWDEPWQEQPLDDEPEDDFSGPVTVTTENGSDLTYSGYTASALVCPICEMTKCFHNLPFVERTS